MDKLVSNLPNAKPVPIHLFVAGDEHIIDNEKTIHFLSDLSWLHGRITTYPHARHSLEFEDDSAAYRRDLTAFIDDVAAMPLYW